ncbi:hypothetical protein CLAIMM_10863 [Cladophialophora immunda]|nr:hypothetical protein CLAIMM_10863 [Cladophialophora immunda]
MSKTENITETKSVKSNDIPATDGSRPSISLGAIDDIDKNVLRAQGHEAAMPRTFSRLSSIALGFGITNSWIAYLSNFGINAAYGGRVNVIFCALIAAFVQWFITCGLSEIASAFPSSGGQYHFVWVLATGSTRRFGAYVIGWMTILGWWIIACSGTALSAVSIMGLANFWHPEFVATQWQIWLVYVGVVSITVAPVIFFPKIIPRVAQFVLFMSITGFVICFLILLAMKKRFVSGEVVLASNQGTSGWADGVAWFLGIGNALFAYVGTDAPIHIAEEMHQPGRRLPECLNTTLAIGVVTTVPLLTVMMFTMLDIDAVTSSALPSIELFYQVTGSKGVATFMLVWITIIYTMCITPQWVTCGRMAWAFSRDNGLPFSSYFSKIDPRTQAPLRATILSVVFVWIYGLLFIASTTAFNSIVTSAVMYLNITYAIPQGILLFRGRSILPTRALNLGSFGLFCNAFSPVAVTAIVVFNCFPTFVPTDVATMNWSSVVLVGLFGAIVALWFGLGRRTFRGPSVDMDMISAANLQENQFSKKELA